MNKFNNVGSVAIIDPEYIETPKDIVEQQIKLNLEPIDTTDMRITILKDRNRRVLDKVEVLHVRLEHSINSVHLKHITMESLTDIEQDLRNIIKEDY